MLGMEKRPDWDNVVTDLPGILDRIFVFIENCFFFFQKTNFGIKTKQLGFLSHILPISFADVYFKGNNLFSSKCSVLKHTNKSEVYRAPLHYYV